MNLRWGQRAFAFRDMGPEWFLLGDKTGTLAWVCGMQYSFWNSSINPNTKSPYGWTPDADAPEGITTTETLKGYVKAVVLLGAGP
jgi:hypothetical protein